MIDIHCHILPGVDDGPESWDMAVEMCRMAAEDGITHIVASPHANNEFEYDRPVLEQRLRQLALLTGSTPTLSLGCDFHFSYENVQRLLADSSQFTIEGTHCLLLELSNYAIPPRFEDKLNELIVRGIRPIITHPERNPLLQGTPQLVTRWAEAGALIQITANALTGEWGKTAQRTACRFVECGAAHMVATDAHDIQRRPPLLSPVRRALTEWKGEALARALTEENPATVLRDGEIPYCANRVG